MFQILLGLILLQYLESHSSDPDDPESQAPPDPSQDEVDLGELRREISAYLDQHRGLHTAAELASALSEPQDQVQEALDQLQAQGQVGEWDGRYGVPDEDEDEDEEL